MDITFLFISIALGIIGGFMAGMLGVGGGIIFVPIFREILNTHPVESDKVPCILANSLLIIFFVGLSGSVKQYKAGNTNLRAAAITSIFAIISSLSLTFFLQYKGINNPKLFAWIYAAILILTAIRMWMGRKTVDKDDTREIIIPGFKKFIPAGLFTGLITSVTGLGGGVIMIPYFNKILKLPIKFSTGLSLTCIPAIALPLIIYYLIRNPEQKMFDQWQTGFMLWPAVIPILIGAAIASPFGVKTAHGMKSRTLLFIFLAFICLNLIKILFM